MAQADVKFNEWLQEGFNLYKENIGGLILASLIALLLSIVTVGILAGPMAAGLILYTLALVDKNDPKPEPGDVFKGFNVFLHAFLFFLAFFVICMVASFVLGVIPFLPMLFCYALSTFVLFTMFLIADKNMEFWPACLASIEKIKTNFWPFFGLNIVAGIIGSLGGLLCGIGAIVTLPIQVCILAIAYREVFGGAAAEAAPAE